MQKILIFLIIFVAIFVSGCAGDNTPTCNSPYSLVGDSCCLDINSNNICDNDETNDEEEHEEQEIDISKIDMTFDTYDFDLYINNDGGDGSEYGYITIKNNNDKPILVRSVCVDKSMMDYNAVICGDSDVAYESSPEYKGTRRQGLIEGHTSKVVSFWTFAGSSTLGESKPGIYDGIIELRLYDVDDSYNDIVENNVEGIVIAEAPIKITVHCAEGCCDSGEYKHSDCK